MIPIRDYVPTHRFPLITILLILINIAVFIYQIILQAQGQLEAFVFQYGLVPYDITHDLTGQELFTFVSSMFMHGGLLHIGSNLLYLYIFGNNVEDEMGRPRFVVFYFLAGIIASLAQIIVNPNSTVPGIGASGAIAGVLGAYLVLHPRARVSTLVPLFIFFTFIDLPAVIVLGFWFVLQLLSGLASFGIADVGGIAYFAHIGGFVAGLLLVRLFVAGRRRAR